jgi:hypothetical protein
MDLPTVLVWLMNDVLPLPGLVAVWFVRGASAVV